MKKVLFLLLLLIAGLFVYSHAEADTITCTDTADVYIDQCLTCTPVGLDTNYNTKTRLIVSYHPTKGLARSLLKFAIPDDIEDSQIQSAVLHLSSSAHTGGSSVVVNISCYALNAPFNEATDTWNSLNGGNYDASIFSPGSLPAGNTWQTTIDVTTLLAGNLSKVRDNGILIKLATEGPDKLYQNIASRECDDPSNPDYVEADEPPRLEITYNATTKIHWLVREYYLDILDREPDQAGWEYWTSEIKRIMSLGIYVGEGFQAEARLFFTCQEYLDKGKTDNAFVTDLYQTFLQREPDAGGVSVLDRAVECGVNQGYADNHVCLL